MGAQDRRKADFSERKPHIRAIWSSEAFDDIEMTNQAKYDICARDTTPYAILQSFQDPGDLTNVIF
jgi:hypothetical protein